MNTGLVSRLGLRQAAEKALAAKQAWILPSEDPDYLKLIHELQVHQIELEMQNEVLAETFAEVDAWRAKYQDLYETAPIGYFTLSLAGEILALNQRAAALLGLEPAILTGRTLREFFDGAALTSLDALLSVAQTSQVEAFAQPLLIQRRLQMPLYVNLQARMGRDPASGEAEICLAMMDVSALKMAKEDVVRALNSSSDRVSG